MASIRQHRGTARNAAGLALAGALLATITAAPVAAAVPPVIDPVPTQQVAELDHLGFSLSATGSGTLVYKIESGPAWVTVDPNGAVSVDPPCGSAIGSPHAVTVSVQDDTTLTDSTTFDVAVVVDAPTFDPFPDPVIAEGNTDSLTITVQDDGCHVPLMVTLPSGNQFALPDFATFTDNSDGTGTLDLAPGYSDSGDYPVRVFASYPFSSFTTLEFTIHVVNTNLPPVLDPIADKTVAEGDTLDFTVTASDPDGNSLTLLSPLSIPSYLPQLGATFTDNGDGTASVHFAPDFTAAASSPYTLQVGVTDALALTTEFFQLTVTNTDQPPVLDPIADQTVAEGATLRVNISASDPDSDALFFDTGLLDPRLHAVLTDNGDGTGYIDFAPDFTANAGSPYSITVFANEVSGPLLDDVTFQLTVTNASPSDPVLTVPADITVEATSAAGAAVTFDVTATDAEDGDVTASVLCVPASGSTFPIGTTKVDCTATDSENNIGVAHFNVTVEDTTGPVIGAQGGGELSGIKVTYTVVGTDAVDGEVPVDCQPASGSLFPVGKTTVTCQAVDTSENSSRVSFLVTVLKAPTVTIPPTSTLDTPASGTQSPSWLALLGLMAAVVAGLGLLQTAGKRARR